MGDTAAVARTAQRPTHGQILNHFESLEKRDDASIDSDGRIIPERAMGGRGATERALRT